MKSIILCLKELQINLKSDSEFKLQICSSIIKNLQLQFWYAASLRSHGDDLYATYNKVRAKIYMDKKSTSNLNLVNLVQFYKQTTWENSSRQSEFQNLFFLAFKIELIHATGFSFVFWWR